MILCGWKNNNNNFNLQNLHGSLWWSPNFLSLGFISEEWGSHVRPSWDLVNVFRIVVFLNYLSSSVSLDSVSWLMILNSHLLYPGPFLHSNAPAAFKEKQRQISRCSHHRASLWVLCAGELDNNVSEAFFFLWNVMNWVLLLLCLPRVYYSDSAFWLFYCLLQFTYERGSSICITIHSLAWCMVSRIVQ